MELVAMESSGVKRKSGSMEDEALALLRLLERSQKRLHQHGAVEQGVSKISNTHTKEEVVKKLRDFPNLSRLTEAVAHQ